MNIQMKHMAILRLTAQIIGISFFLSLLPGCQPKGESSNKSVSTDLVTNPISASGEKTQNNLPVIAFDQTKHDFGMMIQGEKLSYTFKFTNTGGSDLIISDISATCGCTAPDWSKAPVKPGGQGKVEVIFNSSGKSGTVSHSVRLLTNAQPNTTELKILAEVYVPNSKK